MSVLPFVRESLSRAIAFGLLAAALAACGAPPSPGSVPPDPKLVSEIGTACMGSGFFKAADGVVTMFVPEATLPVALINAGVDKVCADPTAIAGDVALAKYWISYLKGLTKKLS